MWSLDEILRKLEETKSYCYDKDNQIVLTKEQIGECISTNFEDAIEFYESNQLLETFEKVDAEIANKIKEYRNTYSTSEEVIFRLQYDFNPGLLFSYKEFVFRDIKQLGDAILNKDIEIDAVEEILKLKLISYYLRIKKIDTIDEKMFDAILLAEDYVSRSKEVAYYLLGYILGDIKYYKYGKQKFESVIDLYAYLSKKKKIGIFSKVVEKDPIFFAWLFYLGNKSIVDQWNNIVEDTEEKEKTFKEERTENETTKV